jgi:WD40 repeat protein
VRGIAFSADGNTLISGHMGSNILLWNAKSGERLNRLTNHGGDVLSVQRLPMRDGFVSTSADNTIRYFDLPTGEQRQVFRGHRFNVAQVTFNAAHTLMVSTGQDATVRLWEPASARELRTIETGDGSAGVLWTRGVAFSPDNLWIVAGNDIGELLFLGVLNDEVRAELAASRATPTPPATNVE